MRFLCVFSFLIIFQAQIFACDELLNDVSRNQHAEIFQDAAAALEIEPSEFYRRLEKLEIGQEEFLEEFLRYEEFKHISSNQKFRNFIQKSVKDLGSSFKKSIKYKMITDMNLIKDFLTVSLIHLSTHVATHALLRGNEAMDLVVAQVISLAITELSLTTSSAKSAVEVLSDYRVKKFAKNAINDLEKEVFELEGINSKKLSFLQSLRESITTYRKENFELLKEGISHANETFKAKITELSLVAFPSGLPAYYIWANSEYMEANQVLFASMMTALFHTAFISVWSNYRYQMMYGKIFPLINNYAVMKVDLSDISKEAAINKSAERSVQRWAALNMIAANITYVVGSALVVDLVNSVAK